jgi:hypothetical protein
MYNTRVNYCRMSGVVYASVTQLTNTIFRSEPEINSGIPVGNRIDNERQAAGVPIR